MSNVLVGNVGGTKTLIPVYDASADSPIPLETNHLATTDFASLNAIVDIFLEASDTL